MVYTCNVKANVKGLEEIENLDRNECTFPRSTILPEKSNYSR